MPLSNYEIVFLELKKSHYGCGNYSCLDCYPIQYACEYCFDLLNPPVKNCERFVCENCDWENNG